MYGVGDLSKFGTAYNRSMGGVGIATRDKRNINILNPASVTERDPQSFMLDFSLVQGNRYYAQGDMRSSNNTFNVNSIMLSTPVWKSFAMYAGFAPYSDIGYNISAWETDQNILAQTGAILNTVMLITYFVGGQVDRKILVMGAIAIVPMILGTWLGGVFAKRIQQQTFLKLVYIILIASGVVLLISNL